MTPHAVIVFLLLNIHFGISVEIVCTFLMLNVLNLPGHDEVYSCQGKVNYADKEDNTHTAGVHFNFHTDSDVKGLQIVNDDLRYLIKDIEKSFPNLEQINFGNNFVLKLSNEYLVPHKNLEYFMIDHNLIESINNNLFNGLTRLKEFYMRKNNLKNVQHELVLPKGVKYFFNDNACINENSTESISVEKLNFDLMMECPPTITQIEQVIATRENLFTELKLKNLRLKAQLAFLESQNENIRKALSD